MVEPFKEFFGRHGIRSALLVLAFIFFYKLGDSLCTALATPFYLDMGYSKTEIGIIAKNAGLWPMVIGGIVGGIWMVKLGINRALWLFGVVQLVTILGFVWLAWLGPAPSDAGRLAVLATVIAGEAIGAGLGTTAFVAYMARTTHPAYTATQLALFTSLMAVPRTFINATSGWLVESLGWNSFFWLCFVLAFPGCCCSSRRHRGTKTRNHSSRLPVHEADRSRFPARRSPRRGRPNAQRRGRCPEFRGAQVSHVQQPARLRLGPNELYLRRFGASRKRVIFGA